MAYGDAIVTMAWGVVAMGWFALLYFVQRDRPAVRRARELKPDLVRTEKDESND